MNDLKCIHVALAAALVFCACGDEDECPDGFDGVYCEFADLEYDNVRISVFPSSDTPTLDIRYRQGESTKLNVIASDSTLVFEPGRIRGEFLTVRALPPGGTQLRTETIVEESSNIILDAFSGLGARARGQINLLVRQSNEAGGRDLPLTAEFDEVVVDGEAGF